MVRLRGIAFAIKLKFLAALPPSNTILSQGEKLWHSLNDPARILFENPMYQIGFESGDLPCRLYG